MSNDFIMPSTICIISEQMQGREYVCAQAHARHLYYAVCRQCFDQAGLRCLLLDMHKAAPTVVVVVLIAKSGSLDSSDSPLVYAWLMLCYTDGAAGRQRGQSRSSTPRRLRWDKMDCGW